MFFGGPVILCLIRATVSVAFADVSWLQTEHNLEIAVNDIKWQTASDWWNETIFLSEYLLLKCISAGELNLNQGCASYLNALFHTTVSLCSLVRKRVCVCPAGLCSYSMCVGSAATRHTRWPVLYLLLVTHHVIMAPGNSHSYYLRRAVWSEINIEAQHHGSNSRVCASCRGPHNSILSRDKGKPDGWWWKIVLALFLEGTHIIQQHFSAKQERAHFCLGVWPALRKKSFLMASSVQVQCLVWRGAATVLTEATATTSPQRISC